MLLQVLVMGVVDHHWLVTYSNRMCNFYIPIICEEKFDAHSP